VCSSDLPIGGLAFLLGWGLLIAVALA